MPMSSDEEIRCRCIELSVESGTKQVMTRARTFYDFIKGDKKRHPAPEPLPMNVTQEVMVERIRGQVKPT